MYTSDTIDRNDDDREITPVLYDSPYEV